jgi:hypothetical protein
LKDKIDVVASATTKENKLYFDGGTTPDSEIVVIIPKPNYLTLIVVGVIGFVVFYKVFLNKK